MTTDLPVLPAEWLTADPFEDEDLPPGTYDFEGEDATVWQAVSEVRPDLSDAWTVAYRGALRDFAGPDVVMDEARDTPTFEVSVDGVPRELRALMNGDTLWDLVLWADVNVGLWIEELALQHSQRLRFRERNDDDVEDIEEYDDDFDEDALAYEPLEWSEPTLTQRLKERHTKLFIRFGRFDASHAPEMLTLLEIMISRDVSPPVLRCTSRVTGETTWYYDWTGDETELLIWIEELAAQHGSWCDRERVLNGPMPWDAN